MNGLSTIKTIARRELASYFTSPVAYVFIVIFLAMCGIFTFLLGGFFERGEASLVRPFFDWHPWLYLFLVPAAGMRVWAEERRLGTLELLLTMPVTAGQAIIGKFLASWLFLIIALALTFPTVLTVCYLGKPDLGTIFTGYVGSALLAGAYHLLQTHFQFLDYGDDLGHDPQSGHQLHPVGRDLLLPDRSGMAASDYVLLNHPSGACGRPDQHLQRAAPLRGIPARGD